MYEDQHAKLAERLNLQVCRECHRPATRVRSAKTVHPWNHRPSGANLTEYDFVTQLEFELDEPDPAADYLLNDGVVGVCNSHFGDSARNPDQPDGDSGAGPSEGRLAAARRHRDEVLDHLGRECTGCKTTEDAVLTLTLKDHLAQVGFWSQQGLTSWPERMAWLTEHLDQADQLCHVRCAECAGRRHATNAAPNPQKANLRQQVVEGYGRMCSVCKTEVNWRSAWVVRKSGAPPLKWGSGSGRKLTSRQKYQRLINEGFPETHELKCPNCAVGGSGGDSPGRRTG